MSTRSKFEQHVAVFGESGSGKTTLLSVFYGHQQAAGFAEKAGYALLASDTSQGQRLLQAYHMLEDDLTPPHTRYQQTVFSFGVRPPEMHKEAGTLVWHDYPGEWWSETKTGEELARKQETFSALLRSDVALFLVDGKRLHDGGKLYVPRLFKSFRDELSRQRAALIDGEKRLKQFPRVWIICLSKADLFPDKDVHWFRTQVLKVACDEVEALRKDIGSMVEQSDFVSLGDSYLLLSSAQFDSETGRIADPTKTIGIDLIPPLSISSPLQLARKWAGIKAKSLRAAELTAEAFRGLTTNWMKWVPIVGHFFHLVDEGARGGVARLKSVRERAIAKGDAVDAVLASFALRLRSANARKTYIDGSAKSRRRLRR